MEQYGEFEIVGEWIHGSDVATLGADTIVDYSYGMGDQLYSAVNSLKCQTRSATPQTWAQGKEKYSDTIDYYLEELNANIDAFIDSN